MLTKNKKSTNISDLFNNATNNQTYVKVCAPMVRYSKVQFRTLVKNYEVDLCFSPMILADSFCQNNQARSSEFATTISDCPLVVQFAANNVNDFLDASKLVYPYADGVDLNCGCPQRWAMKDGYGCAMLSKPEVIYDMVRTLFNSLPSSFSKSVKIRLSKDLRKTIDLCNQLEKCGINFLTVHGRTPEQKSSGKINLIPLKDVCDSVKIPVIANGGVKTLSDAVDLYKKVNCNGVMAASGLLTNPALFSGAKITPLSCVKMWMDLKDSESNRITFQCYHHHLVFMLEKYLTKEQKQVFNCLSTFDSVDEYLKENIVNVYKNDDLEYKYNLEQFIQCEYPDDIVLKHSNKCRGCLKSKHYCDCVKMKYDHNASDGNYFISYIKDNDVFDFMNMFDESSA